MADRNWGRLTETENRDRPKRRKKIERRHRGSKLKEGVQEYVDAISITRRKHRKVPLRDSESESDEDGRGEREVVNSAFVSEEAYRVNEDWLEDDMGTNAETKLHPSHGHIEDFQRRLPPLKEPPLRISPASKSPAPIPSSSEELDEFSIPMESLVIDAAPHSDANTDSEAVVVIPDSDEEEDVVYASPVKKWSPPKKRRRQTRLNVSREVIQERKRVNYCGTSPLRMDSRRETPGRTDNQQLIRQILIKFSGADEKCRACQIPMTPEVEEKTVGWLIEDAVNRFCASNLEEDCPTGVRLVFRGADLAGTDKIRHVLQSSQHDIEVWAEPRSWKRRELSEKYEQMCRSEHLSAFDNIRKAMATSQENQILDLKRMGLSDAKAVPVFKALQGSYTIKELILNQNTLSHKSCRELGKALGCLVYVDSLSLVCTGIRDEELQCIATEISSPSLPRMKKLDLSQNALRDDSWLPLRHLLARMPNLETLSLRFCQLTHRFFSRRNDTSLFQGLEKLECLDVSRNGIGSEGVKKLCGMLDASVLRSLHLMDTVHDVGETSEATICHGLAILSNQACAMEFLDLSGLPVGGSVEGGERLGRISNGMPNLRSLRLAATKFSEDSAAAFLKSTEGHRMLRALDFSYCDGLRQAGNRIAELCGKRDLLSISLPFKSQLFQSLWSGKHGSTAAYQETPDGMCEYFLH